MAVTFPSVTPTSATFGIKYNTFISNAALNGMVRTIEMPGARWVGSVSFSDLNSTDLAKLRAFVTELRGSSGRFNYGDPGLTGPQDPNLAGTLTIETGSDNRIIKTTPDTGGGFTAGDYIQIGDLGDSPELKTIVSVSGAIGTQQSLIVEPMIRRTDYLGQTITYNNPKTEFGLLNEDQLRWNIRTKVYLSDVTLDFVEFFT
jgi:hypothetical protein